MDAKELHATLDARVWAREFCATFHDLCPALSAELATIEGWFANAILCGYDYRDHHPPG